MIFFFSSFAIPYKFATDNLSDPIGTSQGDSEDQINNNNFFFQVSFMVAVTIKQRFAIPASTADVLCFEPIKAI